MTGAWAHLITLWISILLPDWAHGRFETMKWKWLCIHYFSCYDQILTRALKGGRFILAHSLKGYSLSQRGRYGGRLLDSTAPSSSQAGTFHFLEFCPAWKELSYSLWLSNNWNNGSQENVISPMKFMLAEDCYASRGPPRSHIAAPNYL